jgi:hypothetical protein
MIDYNIVQPPKSGTYFVEWEPLVVTSEKEKAEIAYTKIKTLTEYKNSIGADLVVPEQQFKSEFLGMSWSAIEQSERLIKEEIEDDSK